MAIVGSMDEEQVQFENWKITFIISSLQYLPFSSEQRESIRKEFDNDITPERVDEILQEVYNNLPEPIESGLSYGMRDIHKKLDLIERDSRK